MIDCGWRLRLTNGEQQAGRAADHSPFARQAIVRTPAEPSKSTVKLLPDVMLSVVP